MTKAWTENNDGKELPDDMEATEHSGDFITAEELDAQILEAQTRLEVLQAKREGENRHVHVWKKGLLPGQIEIRTCECGAWERV